MAGAAVAVGSSVAEDHDKTGMAAPVTYWHMGDITKSLKALLDAGAKAEQDVKDVGGGKLTATVKDADGNVIGLLQPGTGAW